ncbi:hypothetical protein [Candidatus Lariskella endosymbiont of Hedychridium roseum]|uniref:hypothetical protein n=1 Tax=Candidatus Lariskella endosymbiont of Hedychridium roseum TaxID=3077949 RepID=UPI0030CD0876
MVRSYYEFFGQSPQDQITARIERAFWAQKEEEAKQRKLFPRLQNDLLYLAALEKYELIEKITDYQAAVATGLVKTLDFSHNKLSYISNSMVYKIYKIMSNMLYKTSVEKLTLWNNHFGKEHNNALRAILLLTKDSSVKFLDLGHNYIGYMNQGDISSIFSIFKNLNITHINLSNNHLGRLDVSNLLILLDLLTIGTKITHIDISSNALCEMN